MTVTDPITDVMSRSGKGTEADHESGSSQPVAWVSAQQRLRNGGQFWLATMRSDGRPHVMPLFAAWSSPVFFVCSKGTARKTRNLAADGRCVLTTDTGDLHIVIEGDARRVQDAATLARASQAFAEVYDWPTTVTGAELDAEYGAPTSGGPPYQVYEIAPSKGFAFPVDGESFTPTRWRFDR